MDEELYRIVGGRVRVCKYGENAWQTGEQYSTGSDDPLAIDKFISLTDGEPSLNGLGDIDRAVQAATHIVAGFDVNYGEIPFIALAVKHGNCCGAAVGGEEDRLTIVKKMLDGDPLAVFGGIVLLNFPIDKEVAEVLRNYNMPKGKPRILDGIVAPYFSVDAIEILRRKKERCKMFANTALASLNRDSLDSAPRFRYIRGGFLVQTNYTFVLDLSDPDIEKSKQLSWELERDFVLAWAIGATANSNSTAIVKDGALIGNGVGQQDRVGVSKLAGQLAERAGHDIHGAVAYTDSFFPQPDGPQVLADMGIIAIFASRGSIKDEEVKATCERNGVAFYTGQDSKVRGFYGH